MAGAGFFGWRRDGGRPWVMARRTVFLRKDQAITYAQNRASFRSGEIRILDSTVEGAIPFNGHVTHPRDFLLEKSKVA